MSALKEFLFIGGSADGERRFVNEKLKAIKVAVKLPGFDRHNRPIFRLPSVKPSMETEIYLKQLYCLGDKGDFVFVVAGMSDDAAQSRLNELLK